MKTTAPETPRLGPVIRIRTTPVTAVRHSSRVMRIRCNIRRRTTPVTSARSTRTFRVHSTPNAQQVTLQSARIAVPRRLFREVDAEREGYKRCIRVMGDGKRTQPELGTRSEGPLMAMLACAVREDVHVMQRRGGFVDGFANVDLHQERVSFVARVCAFVSGVGISVLIDEYGIYALVKGNGVEEERVVEDGRMIHWKNCQVDHRGMPVEVVNWLLDETEKNGGIQGGRAEIESGKVLMFTR